MMLERDTHNWHMAACSTLCCLYTITIKHVSSSVTYMYNMHVIDLKATGMTITEQLYYPDIILIIIIHKKNANII